MTEFKKLQEAVKKQFNDLKDKSNFIFSLNLDKNELWEVYLNSFPEGTNDIYRERREHDCSACRNFINKFGDKVFIIDNKKVSVWDFKIDDNVYNQVIKTLSEYIKNKEIKNVWFSKEKDIGQYKDLEDNEGVVKTWYHFYLELPNKFIVRNNDNNTKKICKYRDIRQVLERSLNEISSESINTVLELINQKSLYRVGRL